MLIDAAFARSRVVLLLLGLMFALGLQAYVSIAKEAAPDVTIPVVFVSTGLEGISPEDGERLLVQPLETELAGLDGLREMRATASEGNALVTLEFDAGFDPGEALEAVRRAVDRAAPNLPSGARDSQVRELSTAEFPVVTVVLSGPLPERTLNLLARTLRDRLEGLEGVLEVDIAGARDDLVEVLVDPTVFETYDIGFDELIRLIARNSQLIAAGSIETAAGRVTLTVPGLIEDVADVFSMPVMVRGDTVVTFADVATVRRGFEDRQGFARINGQPALALEVKKRAGANILDTVQAVRAATAEIETEWDAPVTVDYLIDISTYVDEMLGDLESNVIAAVILVMIVIVWALGLRNALLVGLAIPGAFLTGVAALWMIGYTMNVVVLFALIFVVGMLVDGAIVTVELADRKLQQGVPPPRAYAEAAKRMALPIIAATATTLAVFLPLLFWQGVVGEFMKYLPVTVFFTLTASLAMALVFVPVIGGLIGRARPQSPAAAAQLAAAETGDPRTMRGPAGAYVWLLEAAVRRPATVLLLVAALLIGAFGSYARFGAGVAFFPEVEPDFAQVQLRSRDDLSVHERDAILREAEELLAGFDEIRSVYARSFAASGGDEELIGAVLVEFIRWDRRRPAAEIAEAIRGMDDRLPGIDLQVRLMEMGPPTGKPVALELQSPNLSDHVAAVRIVRAEMARLGGFADITDTLALPGLEWRLVVNRAEAARFGADVALLGQAVRLLTQGITLADYRPEDADGTVDIRVRFPPGDRTLEALQNLHVPAAAGRVPISNFVRLEPAPRTGTVRRASQQRVATVEAEVATGWLSSERIASLGAALERADLPASVSWTFRGEAEEQAEAQSFLSTAFLAAAALMFTILVLQFNSFHQALIVMSAILFSTAGVLLGLLITGRPFGVVMGGVGTIALAGIVVNNNIVLIDTYNALRRAGEPPLEAVLRTGAQRLRPVLLTSLTTGLGLMPMVLGLNLDFVQRIMVFGAPSTQWWTELSATVVGGLAVATALTLLVTPMLLVLGERMSRRHAKLTTARPGSDPTPASSTGALSSG
jgi:multidrug efflux pump